SNLARKATRVRVFEAGRVFRRDPAVIDGPDSVAGVDQPVRIAGLAYGMAEPLQWSAKERAVDFYDVKGDVEALCGPSAVAFVAAPHPALHPGRSARVEVGGHAVGFVGELHPEWRLAYELPSAPIVFELDVAGLQARELPVYAPLPRQQSAWRDIAVIACDAVTHEALMESIGAIPGGLVRSARLFDIYKPDKPVAEIGAGERSLAIRLEIRADDATLTDERIDVVVADVLAALRQRLGLRLRS
ncbi:MAG: phenylalanine--tRNA ligase subunit beta, partial [Caldimonas sp.]